MQREIKFRAWYKYGKKMIEVIQIDFIHKKIFIGANKKGNAFSYIFLSDCELMQYTGLKDNSDCLLEGQEDKEVYEGDIVSVSYENEAVKACVKYETGMFILVSNEFADGYIPIYDVTNTDREYQWIDGIVIGNIYENPELITQSPS